MSANPIQTTLTIKPRSGQRAKSGHPWLFSNEVEHPTPLPLNPGLVKVKDERGSFFGYGLYNPRSLVSVRLLTRSKGDIPGSADWFAERILKAADFRNRIYPERTACRLIHGESDGLPGLVVDYYNGVLAIQIHAAAMEALLEPLMEAFRETLRPSAVILRNDHEKRSLEQLESYVKVVEGELPETVEIEEYGVRLAIDVMQGQKTGHFFDQAENRLALAPFAEGAEALDLFCYSGAWGLKLLLDGAKSVTAVDSSERALELANRNAELNSVADRFHAERADAFAWLSQARAEKRRFDIVAADPPAFAKGAKQTRKALRGYEDLHRQTIRLVRDGGILCACSCSYFVSESDFLSILVKAASRERKQLRILEIRGQSRDHPILAAMPESRYLKCVIAEVSGL